MTSSIHSFNVGLLGVICCGAVVIAQARTASFAIDGRLAVGSTVYSVSGSARQDSDGLWRISFELLVGGALKSSIVARVNRAGGELFIDGGRFGVPAVTASAWIDDLSSGWRRALRDPRFSCRQAATATVCDTVELYPLTEGVSGRHRFTFGHGKVQLRFFSLAEWNNSFNEYLELSLNLVEETDVTAH